MQKPIRIAAILVLLAALGVLIFTHWWPALLFLPVGTAMLLSDGRTYSVPFTTNPQKKNDSYPYN